MRVWVLLACSIALGATMARAQVNGPITISPHDETPQAAPPSAAAPENPAPPAANLPPATAPATPPPRPRQAMPQHPATPPDRYGGPAEGPVPELPQGRRHGLRARFAAANVTHDGRLTPEQAMMGLPGVARHFAEIDRDNRGYVTIDEIRAWRHARRHQNMTPPMPGPEKPGTPGGAESQEQ